MRPVVTRCERIHRVTTMLMSDGPWSPEHIYQEIVGYGKARQRGQLTNSSSLGLAKYRFSFSYRSEDILVHA